MLSTFNDRPPQGKSSHQPQNCIIKGRFNKTHTTVCRGVEESGGSDPLCKMHRVCCICIYVALLASVHPVDGAVTCLIVSGVHRNFYCKFEDSHSNHGDTLKRWPKVVDG